MTSAEYGVSSAIAGRSLVPRVSNTACRYSFFGARVTGSFGLPRTTMR